MKPVILLALGLCCLFSCSEKQEVATQIPRGSGMAVPKVAAAHEFSTTAPYIEALLEGDHWLIYCQERALGTVSIRSVDQLKEILRDARGKLDVVGIEVRLLISVPAGARSSALSEIIRTSCSEGIADIFFLVTTSAPSSKTLAVSDAFYFPAREKSEFITAKLTAADAILIRKPRHPSPVEINLPQFDEFLAGTVAAASARRLPIACTLTIEPGSSYQRLAELLSTLNEHGILQIMLDAPPGDNFGRDFEDP